MTKTAATLSDVARRAGVSRVVASTVVNSARTSARVSSTTRERILAAARELRYVPNAAAQSLRRPGMNLVGVAFNRAEFTFISNPFVAHVLEGIVSAATTADYNIALFTKPWVDGEQSAPPYRDRRTDGLIVIAPFLDSDMVPELTALGLPLVLIAAPASKWNVPAVSVDNVQGAAMVAQHLLALGHRRIGFVSAGTEDIVSDAQGRRQGFLDALSAADVTVPDDLVCSGDFNFQGGYAAAQALLSHPDPPTALFAANDFSAIGALKAADDLGIPVPECLSVVGFDDMPDAGTAHPPLTTIRSPTIALGRLAGELLIAQVAGEKVAPVDYLHPPELVLRGSTAPCWTH